MFTSLFRNNEAIFLCASQEYSRAILSNVRSSQVYVDLHNFQIERIFLYAQVKSCLESDVKASLSILQNPQ